MWHHNRRLVKRVLIGATVFVVVIALGLGALRLMLTRLPSYQAELQAWVTAELGLSFSFDRLDARFGANGPEITFYEASVASAAQAEPFLYARRAAVSLDPWKLLLEREPTVSALVIDGTRLAISRTADGAFRFEGGPAGGDIGGDLTTAIPLEVELLVRDSQVQYVDELREESWQFDGVELSLTRERDRIALEMSARPPEALGERIDLAVDGDIVQDDAVPGRWRVFGDLRNVNLTALMRLLPATTDFSVAGSGDVSVWIDWSDGRVSNGMTTVALDDVAFSTASADTLYDRLALRLEWSQGTGQTWQFALSDVELSRDGRSWPNGANSTLQFTRDAEGVAQLSLRSDFLRLDDLTPMVSSLPRSELVEQWRAFDPRGDLRGVEVSVLKGADGWEYSLAGEYAGLGIEPVAQWPGFSGLTGEARTNARSGRIQFRSSEVRLDWPEILPEALDMDELRGLVVWRQGRDVIRIVSDDLLIRALDGAARSNFELTLPLDASSPSLDLATRVSRLDVTDVKRYLPADMMPQALHGWIDRAILGGQFRDIRLSFFGPVASFPFFDGDGQLRVIADVLDGEVEFADGWPIASELEGELELLNASLHGSGSGRILGNVSDNVEVGIENLRDPVLTLEADTTGPLADVVAMLNTPPSIARQLGPDFARLQAPGGIGEVNLALSLPLMDRSAYALRGRLTIVDGELYLDGVRPRATEIHGVLDVEQATVTGDGIEGIFLDGPVTARVVTPEVPGYRAELQVAGEATTAAVATTFDLPLKHLLAGQARWQGQVLIAERQADEQRPVRITVDSNLVGVSLKFPAPFAKEPAEAANLRLELEYPERGRLRVNGNIGASRRFALNYRAGPDGYRLARGAARFGGAQPELPAADGFTVYGSLPEFDVSAWLALSDTLDTQRAETLFTAGELELAELFAFGQQLGSSTLSARRDGEFWRVDVESEAIAGSISIPGDLTRRPQIVAEMQRLYLSSTDSGQLDALDPRRLPGLSLTAEKFGFGTRRLGRVIAEIVPDGLGLRLDSFQSSSDNLTADANGIWFVGTWGAQTRATVSMSSTDVAGALEALDFAPMIEAELADVTASVNWAGAPATDWMRYANGDVTVRVETGSMLDIEPGGAGRVAGLMSFVALPRRLALDFRDVFNRGFAFDEITGDFRIVDGHAYTNNLKLTGPGAEIGVVGRTGLRDRDYEQMAIVTAEPGNILPTVGALLSGPAAAAALLIFTQIFKKPLSGIGQASYCIRGSWEEPEVERLSAEQIEEGALCAALPPAGADAQAAQSPGI